MAGLIINDPYGGGQELISSGRSSIPLSETYSTDPRAINAQYSDQMRNVNQLVDALSGLSKTVGSVEDQNRKLETANAEAYVADVQSKLNSTDPVDKQLAMLRPDLNPWTRAAMSQIVARQQAALAAQTAVENMPPEARETPEKTQAYFDRVIQENASRVGGQPFYSAPFVATLRSEFAKRSGQLSAERTAVMTEAMRQDGRTQHFNAMEGFLKTGQLAIDPSKAPSPEEASEIVAFSQKYGINPVSATMLLQMLEKQATPDTSITGETAQKRPIQEQIAQLERALVSRGIRQGTRFEDLYAAVNPRGNMREDVRTFLPSAAAALGLPFDERYSTLGGISPKRRPSQPAGPVDDAFSVDGVPIRHSFDPAATYGRSASQNAQQFSNIVLHHAVGNTDALVKYGQREDAQRGGAFGYHFYIDPDGTIVQGAPMSKRTNHVKPENAPQRRAVISGVENNNSIGITLVNAHRGHTPQQEESLKRLVGSLTERFGIDQGRIFGHGELQSDRMSDEGKLARVLRGNAPPSSAPAVTGDFRSQVAAAAKAAGVPDALIPFAVAQAGFESGDGKSNLARNGNNLFGIKADSAWSGEKVTTKTTEVVNGQRVQVDAQFRKYGSLEESVKDWWAKIQRNYPETASATTIEQAVEGLYKGRTGNYATAPKEEYMRGILAKSAQARSLGAYGFQPAGGTTQQQQQPSVSTDPANASLLSPDTYAMRLILNQTDGMFDKTHPLYARTLRKQDAIANTKQLAMSTLNPELLDAFPRSMLTPAEREDLANYSAAIRKEIQAQRDRIKKEQDEAIARAKVATETQLNEMLLTGKPIPQDFILEINRQFPDLAAGLRERMGKMEDIEKNPRASSTLADSLRQEMTAAFLNGTDPNEFRDANRTRLNNLTRSDYGLILKFSEDLRTGEKEMFNPIYQDMTRAFLVENFNVNADGLATPRPETNVLNPDAARASQRLQEFLVQEIANFASGQGRAPSTPQERIAIFKTAELLTLQVVKPTDPRKTGDNNNVDPRARSFNNIFGR